LLVLVRPTAAEAARQLRALAAAVWRLVAALNVLLLELLTAN
jgi:hypothetical protein